MLLHVQQFRPRLGLSDVMNAMSHFRFRIGNVLRLQPFVDWLPGFSGVVAAERSGRGDCNEDAPRRFWIEQNAVQTHAARARLPLRSGAVAAQAGKLLPCLAAIGAAK